MRLVAGIGCRRGTSGEEVMKTLAVALLEADRDLDELKCIATIPRKMGERGIISVAAMLELEMVIVDDAAVQVLLTESAASRAATGLGSVAEAAALAAAGPGARLLGPRVASGGVTCALAEIAA